MVRVIDHLALHNSKAPLRPGMAGTDKNKHSINFLVHEPPRADDLFSSSTRAESDVAMSPVDDLLHAANIIAASAAANARPSPRAHAPATPPTDTFSASSNGSSLSSAPSERRGGVQKRRKKRPNVSCDICHRMFGEAAAVRKHKRVVHDKVKDFQCHICERRFAEKSNLKKHIQARHEQMRSHKCDQCDKVFNFTDGLRRHINNCHLGLRPYKCSLCESSFKQRTHLQKHRASVHHVVADTRKDAGRPVAQSR